MTETDVVVVSYNSREGLRETVEPLAGRPGIRVFIVDNASQDGTLESVADLDLTAIPLSDNRGFAHGCNVGWRAGQAPQVLFLNPDAAIDDQAIETLAEALRDPAVGAVAPRILEPDGSLDYSLRRFPQVRSTFAQALFLHRVFPAADWTDEVIREEDEYERERSADWVSGACVLVRRDVLEAIDGLDESFFLYCEDIDLCRRIWDAGYEVRYVPAAVSHHEGGASAPRTGLLPVLAASRIRYAKKHRGTSAATLERIGVGLGAVTHILVGRGGAPARAGHARALRVALLPLPDEPSRLVRST